jgi:hypothetical protein
VEAARGDSGACFAGGLSTTSIASCNVLLLLAGNCSLARPSCIIRQRGQQQRSLTYFVH